MVLRSLQEEIENTMLRTQHRTGKEIAARRNFVIFASPKALAQGRLNSEIHKGGTALPGQC